VIVSCLVTPPHLRTARTNLPALRRLQSGQQAGTDAAAAQPSEAPQPPQRQHQQQQQQQQPPASQRPPLIELLEDRGARLTTAAQMAWAQVGEASSPGPGQPGTRFVCAAGRPRKPAAPPACGCSAPSSTSAAP
jgi:hypothetical protein